MRFANRRLGVVLIALLLLSAVGTGLATAQEEGGEEGGELLEVSGWAAVATLLVGSLILLASIELLIHALIRTALRFGVSAFLLAIIFSGWEFDNVAFGLFTGFAEMQNVAFGLAIGNSVSIFGMTLALGAIAVPFAVDVPRDYLLMMVGAPLLLIPPLLSGSLTPALSLAFIAMYVIIFAYIYRREGEMDRTFMESDEVKEVISAADGQGEASVPSYVPAPIRRLTEIRWFWPAMLLVGIGGIVVGAESASTGVEGIQATWNLTGTFIGVTLVTVLLTLDDLLLIIEPLRLGYYDVAVGGVIGSLLFFVTANIGIIGLVGTINFRWETVFFHLPSLFVFTGLAGYLFWKGEVSRRHGALLLGMYVLYLAVNIRYFATLPVEG
ncbi:sodium:calcium antiporter [Haloplanus sp. C73]|uniref:sodium:calcium antiporter n=1 Tax=Haloplanus sp. C73 TaxID=3421641 RepID=UPI003EBF4246